jgi:hypothetical protein
MKKNIIVCGLATLLVGCSLGDEIQETSSEYAKISKVGITVEPFTLGDDAGTRTAYTYSETTGMSFSWSAGDTLGVFPIEPSGSQVYQVLKEKGSETTDELSYSFDGDAWLLKAGNSYASYHPFAHSMRLDEDYKSVPVNMTGQKQNGNMSTAHLGDYHIMYAPAVPVPAGSQEVNLEFHNVNSLIKVDLTVPVAATWKKLMFESDNAVFITSALMDATNGKLTPKKYSNSIELDLENITSTANQTLTFFISLLPTTTGEVSLSAITSDNTIYTATLPTKTTVAAKIYRWSANLALNSDDFDDKDYVDLGTGDGVLWGRYNVNVAGTTSFEYYAWAETKTKSSFTLYNYDSYDEDEEALGYCTPGSGGRSAMSQAAGDDVAYLKVLPKKSWRIPTSTEMQHLIDRCNWEWTTMNGVNGYKVSNVSVPARWIFIPVAGYMDDTSLKESTSGYYWTANLNTMSNDWEEGYCLKINSAEHKLASKERWFGLTIRPVYIGE